MSSSTNSLTSKTKIGIDYNRITYGVTTWMLKISSLTNSSASAAQIKIENDKIDDNINCSDDFYK